MSEELNNAMLSNESDIELTSESLEEVTGGYEEVEGYQMYDVPLNKANQIRDDLAMLCTRYGCTKAQAKAKVKKNLSDGIKKKYPDLIKLVDDLADEIYAFYGKA